MLINFPHIPPDAVDHNAAGCVLQVDVMKKAYHTAFKEEKAAASRESTSKLENNNPEAQKKLQEKVEKCQQEVQKVRSLFSLFCSSCKSS